MTNLIYDARIARGYTAKQTAEACGVNVATYKRWERLEPSPKAGIIVQAKHRPALAKALGLTQTRLNEFLAQLTTKDK